MGNKHHWKKRLRIVLWAVLALFMLSAVWGLVIEPSLLTVTEFTLTDGRLPRDMDGIRVVFITDIHTGPFFPPEDVERLCAKINPLQPDMVLFGGDLLTHEKELATLDTVRVAKAFATLNPRLGKAAILGNHDIQSETMRQSANKILSDGGFTVLDNTAVQIEPGFYVSGTEPWPMPGTYTPPLHSDADKVAWTTDNNAFSLLLAHEPAQFVDASEYPFALTLSGHTHGGQVALPFHGVMLLPNGSHVYKAGPYELNGRKMYVSRGIGTSIIRLRLFVPPEIVVITLHRE
jgi:uncharacterized protein